MFLISKISSSPKHFELYITVYFISEILDKLREEKSKAEDVKERALSLLQDKEREFSANQRRWESDLLLSEQQLEQYKEQLQIMSASASPSVVQIVYVLHLLAFVITKMCP